MKRVKRTAVIVIPKQPFIVWGNSVDNNENRRLQERPSLSLSTETNIIQSLSQFKDDYTAYYEDNFALKPFLFAVYSAIQNQIFNTNPIPNKVVKGVNGWYFLGDYGGKPILESKGIITFTQDQTDSIKSNLESKTKWASENGIQLYVAIAPNKHTIYGDSLPIKSSSSLTKLQHLSKALNHAEVNFIDFSEHLRDSAHKQLYDPTNTHWNGRGSYLAYVQLIDVLKLDFPELTALSRDQVDIFTKYVEFDELTKMLSLPGRYKRIDAKVLNPKFSPLPPRTQQSSFQKRAKYERRFICSGKPLKVLIYRDSFAGGLVKYLRESFGESVFIWSYEFDKDLILEEKPDLVIREIVERNIDVLLEE